ncbi:MAG: twin-arginine translocation signal domain-containing protein, partial [Verrucomicrobia bacterium]|nr:twin-arginine translocation signal domain-containing protein [Verrucomicrobiota bacterium]
MSALRVYGFHTRAQNWRSSLTMSTITRRNFLTSLAAGGITAGACGPIANAA